MNESMIRDHLAKNLDLIEPGLTLITTEYKLNNAHGAKGFIDILAKDRLGNRVIVELKRSDSAARQAIHEIFKYVVASGWTECIPILMREQSLVVETLKLLRKRFPFPIAGMNTDNDSSFINESVMNYCNSESILFTRSRPCRKNDQAWIEQKNGSIVRKYLGYHRYSGPVACQTIAHLFDGVRWHVNLFQPSFKLLSKTRDIARVTKKFHSPQTPCDRLLQDARVSTESKEYLLANRIEHDPVELLHEIWQTQTTLVPPHSNHLAPFLAAKVVPFFTASPSRKMRDVLPQLFIEPAFYNKSESSNLI